MEPQEEKKKPQTRNMVQLVRHQEMHGRRQMRSLILNHLDEGGFTPLMRAVYDGNIEKVKNLVFQGALLNIRGHKGYTALCLALEICNDSVDNISVLEQLLAWGADPQVTTEDDKTPLYMAAIDGMLGPVELLLACGADPLTKINDKTVRECVQCKLAEYHAINDLGRGGLERLARHREVSLEKIMYVISRRDSMKRIVTLLKAAEEARQGQV